MDTVAKAAYMEGTVSKISAQSAESDWLDPLTST